MKYTSFLLLLFIYGQVSAQDSLLTNKSENYSIRLYVPNCEILTANMGFLDYLKDSKLLKVNTYDPLFQRTYMIDKHGETISSGYMPSAYFSPNDNLIVISGKHTNQRDSFNPYGAGDLTSAFIFGTVNNFISKLKIRRR